MIVDNQDVVVGILKDPATYGEAGPVETIETHISRIFLVGRRAFKLKRAVKLPYVDFSTPEVRAKEVELHSRTAPGLYLDVRRIARAGDRLRLDGSGNWSTRLSRWFASISRSFSIAWPPRES